MRVLFETLWQAYYRSTFTIDAVKYHNRDTYENN